MRKFAMGAFPPTRDVVKSGFAEIMDKLSDFSWHFYRFNIERKLFDAERRASGAAGSGSEERADAGRRRLQADVRLGGCSLGPLPPP